MNQTTTMAKIDRRYQKDRKNDKGYIKLFQTHMRTANSSDVKWTGSPIQNSSIGWAQEKWLNI